MILDAWTALAEAYDDRTRAARLCKSGGGRVAGYLGTTVPVELLSAAGFFPLQLSGEPDAPTPLGDRYMEDLFDPIVRSVFDRLLAGCYDFLDLIVLPRSSDSAQRLYYYLCELRRTGRADLPEILLFDVSHTHWDSSRRHNRLRFDELRAGVEAVAGRSVAPAALSTEIAASNRRRRRLREVVALRRERPARLSGVRALQAFDGWRSLSGEAFDPLIDEALADPGPPPPTGPRLILTGSALDHSGLHALVESLGATVVGDDHAYGEQGVGPHVDEAAEPFQALLDHYQAIPCSRTFQRPAEALTDFALSAGAAGVVFHLFSEEEAFTWEYPAQRRALEALGLGVLSLALQPYTRDAGRLRGVLAHFIEGLSAHG